MSSFFLLILFAFCSESVQEGLQLPEQNGEEPLLNPDPENNGSCEFCVLSSLNVVGRY